MEISEPAAMISRGERHTILRGNKYALVTRILATLFVCTYLHHRRSCAPDLKLESVEFDTADFSFFLGVACIFTMLKIKMLAVFWPIRTNGKILKKYIFYPPKDGSFNVETFQFVRNKSSQSLSFPV